MTKQYIPWSEYITAKGGARSHMCTDGRNLLTFVQQLERKGADPKEIYRQALKKFPKLVTERIKCDAVTPETHSMVERLTRYMGYENIPKVLKPAIQTLLTATTDYITAAMAKYHPQPYFVNGGYFIEWVATETPKPKVKQ